MIGHDKAGRLIGEYDASLRVRHETVWLGDTPVAVLTQSISGTAPNQIWTTSVHYVYADHIDTPRVIVRASNFRMRWRWDAAARPRHVDRVGAHENRPPWSCRQP